MHPAPFAEVTECVWPEAHAGGRGAQRQAHVVAEPPVVEAMDLWTPCV